MLDEKEPPARLKDASHLGQRGARVLNRAQGPGHDDSVEDRIRKGKLLRRGPHEEYRDVRICSPAPRQLEQLWRWIECNDPSNRRTVERQVQPRPDSDLKNDVACPCDSLFAIVSKPAILHRHVDQTRQDQFLVKTNPWRALLSHRSTLVRVLGTATHEPTQRRKKIYAHDPDHMAPCSCDIACAVEAASSGGIAMIQRKSRALAVMLAVMVSAMSVLMLAIGF